MTLRRPQVLSRLLRDGAHNRAGNYEVFVINHIVLFTGYNGLAGVNLTVVCVSTSRVIERNQDGALTLGCVESWQKDENLHSR